MRPVSVRVMFRGSVRDVIVLDDTGGPHETRRIKWQFAELEDPPIEGDEVLAIHRQLSAALQPWRQPDGSPEIRSQDDARAFEAEIDALGEDTFEALARLMNVCGCTLLCYWTDERVAHIRAHIAEARRAR